MLLRLLLVFAIVAPTIVLLRPPASACECQETDVWTPTDDLERSVRVFRGVVTSVDWTSTGGGYDIEFAVATVWKGSAASDITVWTPDPSDQCGYSFDEGKEYVVYVYEFVSSCSRTALVQEAAADLVELGPGATIGDPDDPPTPYNPADRTPLGEKTWIIPIVAALLASVVAFVWFVMKRQGLRTG